MIDGKVKFKRLAVPLVMRKIVIGACMLIISTLNAAIILRSGFQEGARALVLSLGMVSFVCAVLLGISGKKLILPIMPGR